MVFGSPSKPPKLLLTDPELTEDYPGLGQRAGASCYLANIRRSKVRDGSRDFALRKQSRAAF